MIVKILLVYYILINLLAFLMYGVDKKKAIDQKWRIPEKTLIGVAFLGGGIGAVAGMSFFHHKTRKPKFLVLVPIAIFLHVGLCCYLYIRFMV